MHGAAPVSTAIIKVRPSLCRFARNAQNTTALPAAWHRAEQKMWGASCTHLNTLRFVLLRILRNSGSFSSTRNVQFLHRNSHSRSRKARSTGNGVCVPQDSTSPSGYSRNWRLARHCAELSASPTVRVVDGAYFVTAGRTDGQTYTDMRSYLRGKEKGRPIRR